MSSVSEGLWVRQAQRLRYLTLADELGADLTDLGAYEDRCDAHCEHLVVRHLESDEVIGTCNIGVTDGGHAAASLYRRAIERAQSPEDLRVFPVRGLALDRLLDNTRAASSPKLLRGTSLNE